MVKKVRTVLIITMFVLVAGYTRADISSWSQFHGDNAHAGHWNGSIDINMVSNLWTRMASVSLNRATQPCVSEDGSVVFAYGDSTHPDGVITAFSALDGSVLWSNTVLSHVAFQSWSSPIYHNGYVYWAGGTGPSTVYKINAVNGSYAVVDGGWSTNVIDGSVVNASPMIANDLLFISSYGGFAPESGRHYALNLLDGSVAWSNNHGGQGQGAAAYDAGRDCVYQTIYTNAAHRLRAYGTTDGCILWTANWEMGTGTYGAPYQCAIAYENDRIYVQDYNFYGNGYLHVADAANNGAEIWYQETPLSGDSCPAIDPDGNCYAYGDYTGAGKTRAYDASSNMLWTMEQAGGWQACPAWADDYVFCGGQTNNILYLLNDSDGSTAMQLPGSGPVAFGDNAFYTIGYDGRLYAYSTGFSIATAEPAFAFSDVEHWTGSGSNRAALVVDWHDGTRPHALTWGFRWNGQATGLDLWQAVTNADGGLSGILTNAGNGLKLEDIEYVRPSRDGDMLPGTGEHDATYTAYAWDHTGALFQAGIWSYWNCDGQADYTQTNFMLCATGMSARVLQNDSWDAWSFGTGTVHVAPGLPFAALHYPYAAEVVEYTSGSGIGFDWITGALFTNSASALGRPTVDTTGDNGAMPPEETVPVVPVYPAFRAYELVTIGNGGHLTLKFNHPVVDNRMNPYGVDLIVFGNSFQVIGGGQSWSNGDPSNTVVGGSCFEERGNISVSQDGVSWFSFTDGSYADTFMPTLGRFYDPGNVDTNPGAGNEWWGYPTDPTVPPDPSIASSDWNGMNVAEISQRYRGSAGGSGFDIGILDLPVDDNTGCKWIQYVKVERSGEMNPEVDAMVDVSPAAPNTLWTLGHFPWMDDPARESDAADPDGDDIPNMLEYALGRDPTNAVYEPAFSISVCATSAPKSLLVYYTRAVGASDVNLEIIRTENLATPNWTTNDICRNVAVSSPTNEVQDITDAIPMNHKNLFIKMRAYHDK